MVLCVVSFYILITPLHMLVPAEHRVFLANKNNNKQTIPFQLKEINTKAHNI